MAAGVSGAEQGYDGITYMAAGRGDPGVAVAPLKITLASKLTPPYKTTSKPALGQPPKSLSLKAPLFGLNKSAS
eukprot:2022603-Pleurochrysis_carterae.AAC.2